MKINLKDYYPFYRENVMIEVSDLLADQFAQWKKDEQSHQRKKRRYQATYSLDQHCKMETHAVFVSRSPDELYERTLTQKELHDALASLSPKQAKRIYTHCILGISQTAIASAEGVNRSAVSIGIERGLKKMKKFLMENRKNS